jgi:uncharacterized protein (TIGR02246 family)
LVAQPAPPPAQPAKPPAQPARPPVQRTARPAPSPEAQLKPLIDRYFTAWATGNPERAASLYAKDATSVFIDVADGPYLGWDNYRIARSEYLAQFSSVQLAPAGDLKVTRKGTTLAISTVSYQGTGVLKDGGTQVDLGGRFTALWERRGSDWVIVSEHLSRPAPSKIEPPPPVLTLEKQEIPIRALVEQYEANWNAGNGKALSGLFRDDADIGTMATGSATVGRQKVEEMWAQSFGRRPQTFTTRLDTSITSIRFLRPEIAIVDGSFDYWPDAASERRTPPAAQERFSMTVVHAEGEWRIAATRVVPVPKPVEDPKAKKR